MDHDLAVHIEGKEDFVTQPSVGASVLKFAAVTLVILDQLRMHSEHDTANAGVVEFLHRVLQGTVKYISNESVSDTKMVIRRVRDALTPGSDCNAKLADTSARLCSDVLSLAERDLPGGLSVVVTTGASALQDAGEAHNISYLLDGLVQLHGVKAVFTDDNLLSMERVLGKSAYMKYIVYSWTVKKYGITPPLPSVVMEEDTAYTALVKALQI